MNLQSLPQMNPKPQLTSARDAQQFSQARSVQEAVTSSFDGYSQGLAELDQSDFDFNDRDGEVVAVDQYLSGRYDDSRQFQAAEIAFDKETGDVQKFHLIKENGDSYRFEYARYDEYRSSNPTFEVVKDGRSTSFELNPNNGRMVDFNA